MAEKRFRYYETSEDTQIWDSQRNAFYDDFDLDKIAECLNNLHEENEHLRAEVYILQDDILNKRVRNLIEENEQLKSENQELKQLLKAYKQSNDDYRYQIHKAVTEKLTMLELADNCGVDVE